MTLSRTQWLLAVLGTAAVLRLGVLAFPAAPPPAPEERPRGFVSAAEAAETAPDAAPAEMEVGSAADRILAEGCEMPEVLLDTIKEERALLRAEKDRLEARASEVALAVEDMELRSARLETLRSELSGLLERAEARHTEDVDRLVSLYSAMKPDDAARIMDDMDLEVTVMVLGAMRERDAAPVMAGLSPVRARAISKILLERAQLPGDQDLTGIRLK